MTTRYFVVFGEGWSPHVCRCWRVTLLDQPLTLKNLEDAVYNTLGDDGPLRILITGYNELTKKEWENFLVEEEETTTNSSGECVLL